MQYTHVFADRVIHKQSNDRECLKFRQFTLSFFKEHDFCCRIDSGALVLMKSFKVTGTKPAVTRIRPFH